MGCLEAEAFCERVRQLFRADAVVVHERCAAHVAQPRRASPEVWLVNLTDDAVTLYRDPVGGRYATVRTARRGETVTSLRVPSATLRVEDILG